MAQGIDYKKITDTLLATITPYLMKENASVVNAVERCLEGMRENNRRVDRLERKLSGLPRCPTCGRKNATD